MRLHNRQVKADFWRDTEIISAFSIPGRMFYQGLWHLADDSGCLENDILSFKLHLFPLDNDITPDIIQEWVDKLIQMGKAIPYEAEGKKCLYLKNFHKHQTLKNPAPPTVPLPPWITWQPYRSNSRAGKYIIGEITDEKPPVEDIRQPEEEPDLQPSYNVLTDDLQSPSNHNHNQEPIYDDEEEDHARARGEIIRQFESEFGRPLSPIEAQEIARWVNKHPPELITQALKEAVIRGSLRIKYIDAILENWHKNNIRTARDAVEYQRKFKRKQKTRGDPLQDVCPDEDKYAEIYIT